MEIGDPDRPTFRLSADPHDVPLAHPYIALVPADRVILPGA